MNQLHEDNRVLQLQLRDLLQVRVQQWEKRFQGQHQHSQHRALPQVEVAWVSGDWVPLLAGRRESGPGSDSGLEVREAVPEEQDRTGLPHPYSTDNLRHFQPGSPPHRTPSLLPLLL